MRPPQTLACMVLICLSALLPSAGHSVQPDEILTDLTLESRARGID